MSLNLKQIRFADEYIRNGGNGTQAAIFAGYSPKTAAQQASRLLKDANVSEYIAQRQEEIDSVNIASLKEIQEFRTRVLRGEEKDQFGLDASLADRHKAAADLERALQIKQEQDEKKAAEKAARDAAKYRTDLHELADSFHPLIRDIRNKKHREYVLDGGRGSTKSTTAFTLVYEILKNNPQMHALVVRQVANTLRDSVYAQMQWSLEKQAENPLFDKDNWQFKVSPLEIVYKPTGQKIYFRGADDPGKIKSIKVPFGHIGILIFEELDQFGGEEPVRKIEQSAIRGGDEAYVFKMFNPPISKNNWANKYAAKPKESMLVHHSTYLDVPPEWLGKPFIEEAEHLKKVNPDAYAHEYLGQPIGLGTEIFKKLEIRKITDEEIARQERIYQGQDWGWEPDPKAFIRCSYSHATETIMLIDEMGGTCIRTRDMAQKIIDKGYTDYEVRCGVDEIEHINDFKDMGITARPAIVTPGSVRRTHEWLQCRKIVIDPARTPRAYKEFTEYEHDTDKNGEVIDGYPDKNNHWIDALRYATSPLSMRRGNSA